MGLLTLDSFLAVLLQFFIWHCNASNIILYEQNSTTGRNITLDISTCSNLNQSAIQDVNYITLHANCVRLYDQENCSGNFIEVYKDFPEYRLISNWKQDYLQNNVSSAGPCSKSCYQQIYDQNATVEIFSEANYTGSSHTVVLEDCFKNQPEHFIKSIKINNNCVRIYGTPDCQSSGPLAKYELRPGTPYHDNLDKWNSALIKSISLCTFNCPPKYQNKLKKGEVFLFTEANFGGALTKLNLSTNICYNFSQSGNEGPSSIEIGDGTRATLFSEENCNGTNYLVKVSVYNFDVDTKSIALYGYSPLEPSTIDPYTSTVFYTTDDTLVATTDTNIPAKSPEIPLAKIAIISTASCVGLFILVLAILCLKNKLFIRVREKLADKDIKEFFDGSDISLLTTENSEQLSTEVVAQSKPYNKQYEVTRSRIHYDGEKSLRKSDLDVVYEGTLAENAGIKKRISMIATIKKVPVTVKIANQAAGLNGLQSLMKEIKVMMHLGKHDNIADMIGCCTENLRQGKLLLLMEFCSTVTLKSYLQANRETFLMLSEKETIINENLIEMMNMSTPQFDNKLLMKWCIDVSRGMEFLSSANIVHSDLAARNILLTTCLQAKISDFGLSRQMYCYSKNVHTQQEPLPWRWMAIESILRLEFTTKSDVWSYGVLCWEIFTLGKMPYEGIRSKDDYIANWEEGLRLEKPQYSTEDLYALMQKCWQDDPKRRITFMEITESIGKQIILHS